MKKEITNIKASIRARLQNKSNDANRPFAEVMQYYGIERFLYRFSQSKYKDKFILKGALMFTVWDVPERRTTLDIDFLSRYDNQVVKIENVIKDICKIKVQDDGLIFDPKTVTGKRIKEDADYGGVRVKFIGFLDRSQISMQIDVGFGDRIYPRPKMIDYPVILDLPKPRLKGYTAETIVSEKFEAMVQLGSLNSRMKDFYDIWLMTRQFDFNGTQLSEALKRTFAKRKTLFPQSRQLFVEDIYDEQSHQQMLWKNFLGKGKIENISAKLSVVARDIEKFLSKPIDAINKDQTFKCSWKAPGPWKKEKNQVIMINY